MKFLHKIFQRNLPIKIMAILTAIVLWFYVMNEQNPAIEATVTREAQMINVPEGAVVSLEENKVHMKVRALRSSFVSAGTNDFRAEINVEDLPEGRSMEKVNAILPHGFELLEIDPPELPVVVDSVVKRYVDVSIVTTGNPADGVTLASVSGDMEQAQLVGPRSKVKQVVKVIAYLPLTGHEKDFSQRVPLLPVNRQGRVVDDVSTVPSALTADVQLARGLSKKVVTVSPAVTGQLPEGYALDKITIVPAKIEIAGRKEVIDKIQSIATQDIDLSDIEPEELKNGTQTVSVMLRPTPDVVVIDRMVKVEISTKKKGREK
ncbi:MAG: CdaR family protein [Selenomonadaceae bacterium]|nr:CdaR family protein [Selenomonadaceae bacterium]